MNYSNSVIELYFLHFNFNDICHRRFLFVEAEDDLLIYKRILQHILKDNISEQDRTYLIAGEQQCSVSDELDYFNEDNIFTGKTLQKSLMTREEYFEYGHLKNCAIDSRFWKSNILKHGRGACIDAFLFCNNFQNFASSSFYCLVDRDIEEPMQHSKIIFTDCRDLGATILNYYLDEVLDKWRKESFTELCSLIQSSLAESYKVSIIQKALIDKNISENEDACKNYFKSKFNYSLKSSNNINKSIGQTKNAKNEICKKTVTPTPLPLSEDSINKIVDYLNEAKILNGQEWNDEEIKSYISNHDCNNSFTAFRVLTDHIVDNVLFANEIDLIDESFLDKSLVEKVISYCLKKIERTNATKSILSAKLNQLILEDIK